MCSLRSAPLLFAKPEDRFSRVEAHMFQVKLHLRVCDIKECNKYFNQSNCWNTLCAWGSLQRSILKNIFNQSNCWKCSIVALTDPWSLWNLTNDFNQSYHWKCFTYNIIHYRDGKQCGSWSDGFRSQLIWIYSDFNKGYIWVTKDKD